MGDDIKHGAKGKVERVELPSGAWWEFYVPETHGHIRDFKEALKKMDKETDEVDFSLIYWTAGWSLDLPVSVESLRSLLIADSNEAQLWWNDTILPLASPLQNRMRRLISGL